MGPALWVSLRKNGLADFLPHDARDFLEETHRLNEARNQRIRDQAIAFLSALNHADIVPMVLKGGVYLLMPETGVLADRMIGDIDLVSPPGASKRIARIAENLGYQTSKRSEPWSHAYATLRREGEVATIDLHEDIGMQRDLLPLAEAFDTAIQVTAGGARAYVLAPTHQVLFNIFHAAIQDRSHDLGRIPLRRLHDLCLLSEIYGDDIDWIAVREQMTFYKQSGAFDGYLYMAHQLLGMPLPPGLKITGAARLQLWLCLLLKRRPFLRRIVNLWGTFSHPFTRARLDYLYGTRQNYLALQKLRLRVATEIIEKHRGGLFWKFLKEYQNLYRSS